MPKRLKRGKKKLAKKKMTKKEDIYKLRETTGAGIMDCKKALEAGQGDFKKALGILKKKGQAIAAKKQSRQTREGLIESYIHPGGRIGVLLEINCETDFVSRNVEFKEFSHELAMQIAAVDPQDMAALLRSPYWRDEKITIKDLLQEKIAKFGENIIINRFIRFSL